MNLHDIATQAIAAVNPPVPFIVKRSMGYTTEPDGHRTPYYQTWNVMLQLQSLDSKELEHMNSMNIGGIMRKVYLDGEWRSVDRRTGGGGDLFVDTDGVEWLFVHALESWPGWTAGVIVKQVPKP